MAWNDLLAAGLRAILPLAVRAQDVHFVAGDLYRVADLAVVRPADRDALRGAERAEPRLAEAHDGAAPSRRQRARTTLRSILSDSIVGLRRWQ